MIDRYDEPWKEALSLYLPDFFRLLFPQIHDGIDWARPVVGLEQELRKLLPEAELGYKTVDKLIRVQTSTGEALDVLVHIEVQTQEKGDFAKRMFVYNYRTFDRFDRPVVSVAVLGDDSPSFHPRNYTACDLWGCTVSIEFPTVKLREYNGRWHELEASENPFAVVVMAHLKTQATRGQPEERFRWRLQLTRRLYKLGYEKRDVIQLHRFLDWIMTLPEPLKKKLNENVRRIEQENQVRYVSSIEKEGMERGLQQGLQEGLQQGIQEGLQQGIQEGLQQGIQEGLQRGLQQGAQQERQDALLQVCEARKLNLSSEQIQRIKACADLDQLKSWLTRAALMDSADNLFGDEDLLGD